MLQSIKTEVIRRAWNIHRQRGLLALSGGRDSVALFWAFRTLGYAFEAAHINYGLRGAESDGDEAFVRKICDDEGIVIHVLKAAEIPQIKGESTQMWARRVRYDFFEGIRTRQNLDYTAVAHHAGDQLEHFFIYLSRNQKDTAFRGMLPENGTLRRPMLQVLPSEILRFLAENDRSWREDSSNAGMDYVRNKVRNGIIAKLEFPERQMLEFNAVSALFYQEWKRQQDVFAQVWSMDYLRLNYWSFSDIDLQKLPLAWKQAFQQLGFSRDTWRHCQGDKVRVGARFFSSQGWVLVASRGGLWYLFMEVKEVLDWEGILRDGELGFDFGGNRLRWCRGQDWKGEGTVLGRLPKEYTGKLLRVRGFQNGDRMPLKGGGTQKLSDLVTNEKWNPYEKSRMMVAEAGGVVVMVAAVGREVSGWEASDWVLVGLEDGF